MRPSRFKKTRVKNTRESAFSLSLPLLAAFSMATVLAAPWSEARAISRTRVMVRARSFVYHPWRCTTANLTASCDSGYSSVYVPGDYMGLPYDWGGFVSVFEFDGDLLDGLGAGSYSSDGVLSCTTGLDCSGFVSQAWDTAGKYGTSTLPDISHVISQNAVLPGDCFNTSGYHVILYSHTLTNGDPVFYEAVGYNTQINVTGGWSYVSSYTPRRYDDIEGTTAGTPLGTPDNPIPIGSFPFTDSRDTTNSESNVFDGCGAAPTTDESGPEYFYEVTFSQPGTLTVSVTDDVGRRHRRPHLLVDEHLRLPRPGRHLIFSARGLRHLPGGGRHLCGKRRGRLLGPLRPDGGLHPFRRRLRLAPQPL